MNADYPVVDISHWQENPDFEAMAREGVIGVIHKATESTGYVDDDYAPRRPKAEAAGLLWGAYHFLRPGNMEAQARHFVETAGDIDLLAADHEDPGVSLDDLKTFLREVENLTGKKAVIYSGHVIKEQVPDDHFNSELAQHLLWLAHYTSGTPTWPKATWRDWWLWQWTDKGTVPGINGNADCNRYASTEEDLVNEWTGEELEPAPEPEGAQVTITIKITARGSDVTVVTDKPTR